LGQKEIKPQRNTKILMFQAVAVAADSIRRYESLPEFMVDQTFLEHAQSAPNYKYALEGFSGSIPGRS
jgi:hypothetical protein